MHFFLDACDGTAPQRFDFDAESYPKQPVRIKQVKGAAVFWLDLPAAEYIHCGLRGSSTRFWPEDAILFETDLQNGEVIRFASMPLDGSLALQLGGTHRSLPPLRETNAINRPAVASNEDDGSDWFSLLFGFTEKDRTEVRRWLRLRRGEGESSEYILESLVNRRCFEVGTFSTPLLEELRRKGSMASLKGKLRVTNIAGDTMKLSARPENCHATFQVASRFNALESLSPDGHPEVGVSCYATHGSQSSLCAVACGAATVFRNYFMPLGANGELDDHDPAQHGQSSDRQLMNLASFGDLIGNQPYGKLFTVANGHIIMSLQQIQQVKAILKEWMGRGRLEDARAAIRVGVQHDAQVTAQDLSGRLVDSATQTVTQVFTSSCTVPDSEHARLWQEFANVLLEAAYEAVLWVAVLTAHRFKDCNGSRRVFLTPMLGSAGSGNKIEWVIRAMRQALKRFEDFDLEVMIVSDKGPIDAGLLELDTKRT